MTTKKKKLEKALEHLNLIFVEAQIDQLLGYIELLQKWNRVFNLISTQDTERLLSHHILDSLLVGPYLQSKQILDVGSGAGLPGIPLAIMYPKFCFKLLDSNGKKARFLKQAVLELSLSDRVEIVKSRIQEYRPAQSFDTVVSRAFASLQDYTESVLHVCDQHTQLLAMKGRRPDAEIAMLNSQIKVNYVAPVIAPGLNAGRHIVCMQRISK